MEGWCALISYAKIAGALAGQQGIELTPNEVKEALASIAAKFRVVDPSLSSNDDECIRTVLENAKLL